MYLWSNMKKIIFCFLVLIISNISCVKKQTHQVDIDEVSNSPIFKEYLNQSIKFNQPIISKVNEMDSLEYEAFNSFLSEIALRENPKVTVEEFDSLVVKLGYGSKESYQLLQSSFNSSLIDLLDEFPSLKALSTEELKEFLSELHLMNRYEKLKLMDCTYDYSYCVSQAEGTYYAGTAICALSALGSPLAALACQVVNTVIYNGALSSCLDEYSSCQLLESPAKKL